jgi:1-acyl-sn-glycerol-3-phosphate acyltransferase
MKAERSLAWKCLQTLVRPLALFLFDLEVYGRENIPTRGGVLIVSNHQSYLDPILLPLWLERPLNYIAWSKFFENPFLGWILRSVFNAFPVRLRSADVGAIKETIRRLRAGHLMNIYPEGERTPNGEIGPLLGGVSVIVQRAGAAIVPAVIVGAYDAWPLHRRFPRRRPVRIRYGPPMDLTGLGRDELMVKIDGTLRQMYAELSAQAAATGRGR